MLISINMVGWAEPRFNKNDGDRGVDVGVSVGGDSTTEGVEMLISLWEVGLRSRSSTQWRQVRSDLSVRLTRNVAFEIGEAADMTDELFRPANE